MEPMGANSYFDSYENLDIHKLMLEDSPRNQAYKQAIFDNKRDIAGKVVLDVGAGTGILSIFCAQAGASKVYAVEANEVYKIAQETVKENHLEHIVEVVHSKIENLNLPEKVDVIVSEWMGFYLLHEGMLDSVIFARDKFLKPDGLIFPESATLYAAPASIPSMFDSWENRDGVSMTLFARKLREEASRKPITVRVNPKDILTDPEIVTWIDLREVTVEDLSSIKVEHVAVTNKAGKYQGLCLWFTCLFPSSFTEPVTLSTAPEDPETHWKQTTIVLPDEQILEALSPIAYSLSLSRTGGNSRIYVMEMTMLDPGEVEHPEYCRCHMTKCILVRAMLDKYEKQSMPK